MHQTFYIDIEEEISSVVDRLRKSMSADNFFVIPKRAVMLQSAVNLKLLKREADKLQKKVFIVTTDENGASLAKRSGIEVLQSLDGVDSVDDVGDIENQEEEEIEQLPISKSHPKTKNSRLSRIGTNDFYSSDEEEIFEEPIILKQKTLKHAEKKIVHTKGSANTHRVVRNRMDMHAAKSVSAEKKEHAHTPHKIEDDFSQQAPAYRSSEYFENDFASGLELQKEKKIEKMFANRNRNEEKFSKDDHKHIGGAKVKNLFFAIIAFSVIFLGGVAAYLFIPNAKIIVEPNFQTIKSDISVHGEESLQLGDSALPIKTIDRNDSITLQYDSTGRSQASGQKAHGSVVISNSFSSDPQTLIATTRLQSQDGKIFRLSKNIVVPGSITVGGEIKPGAITADVIADEPGSEYNIDASEFTIPGFQGSPKFDKFSAKSSMSMVGGNSSGESGGQVVVSQKDIDDAKIKTEAVLQQKISDEIKNMSAEGDVLLEDAKKITISRSAATAKAGDAIGTFDYTVQASIHALIFSENDIKTLVSTATEKNNEIKGMSGKITKIEYGPLQADFASNTFDVQVHAESEFGSNLNMDELKKEMLGKDEAQLADLMKKNSAIKGINVTFDPFFVNRVPQYPFRVTVQTK